MKRYLEGSKMVEVKISKEFIPKIFLDYDIDEDKWLKLSIQFNDVKRSVMLKYNKPGWTNIHEDIVEVYFTEQSYGELKNIAENVDDIPSLTKLLIAMKSKIQSDSVPFKIVTEVLDVLQRNHFEAGYQFQ